MLVCDPSRQHHPLFNNHFPSSSSPTTKTSQHTFFNKLAQSHAAATASSPNNGKALDPSFDSRQFFDSISANSQQLNDQFMSNSYSYQNPAIRVQQSTPTPGLHLPAGYEQQQQQQQLPFDTNTYNQNWDSFGVNGHMVATQTLQSPGVTRNRSHQRATSSSSIGSNGSASPFSQGHAQAYSYAVSDGSPSGNTASKLGQQYNVDQSSSVFSNHLPTPTQTPTQDTFLASSYPIYSQQGINTVAAHVAMNQAIDNTSNNDEDLPGMSHSARHSISSIGQQEPSTPRTVAGDYDQDFKQPSHDNIPRQNVPKFERTISDAYQDEIYNPTQSLPAIQTQMTSRPSKQYLSPHRNVITERLQAAQIARSQSPTSANSRGVSPFRPDSPYVQDPYMQASRFSTASQVRQRQKQQADANELSQHRATQINTPKTISPKDAMLEYNEDDQDSKMSLFPETDSTGYGQQYAQNYQAPSRSQFENSNSSVAFGNIGASTRAESWTNPTQQGAPAFSTTPISSQPHGAYNFNPSSNIIPPPFSRQNYRQAASTMPTTKQEDTPDFPAHLTSMESSASEAPPSSQNSVNTETQKPASSLADTGTYTCTYHGCSLRFETPQKLQKHKREGHRNPATSPASPIASSAMTSAAILARNSQAGPHKCERINPTTGKPCNTIFSRPYDLTRHEDTIHNARKQKVRCALCVEEKTFSRNDALTRHMRVVHPEVDFPGKHRRRGAHD